MITIRNAKANGRVGVCLGYCPEAVINCPSKSNVNGERVCLAHSSAEMSSLVVMEAW